MKKPWKRFENDNIMIEGCVSLKKDKYAVALAKSDPPGIISSLISRCSPESWKYCYLSNEDKCKQLNWLLGDPKYDDEERLADGDKKINMLIAHAFRLSGHKNYGYRELQLARKAISQGLCELKRKGKRAQLQKKTDSINYPQESSNDNGDDNFSNAVVVDLDKIHDWEEIDENQN